MGVSESRKAEWLGQFSATRTHRKWRLLTLHSARTCRPRRDWWIHGAGPGMTVICNHLLVLPHSGPLYPPESVGGTVVSPQKAAGLGARIGPGGTCRGWEDAAGHSHSYPQLTAIIPCLANNTFAKSSINHLSSCKEGQKLAKKMFLGIGPPDCRRCLALQSA